jgi:hypothetical protein
MDAHEMFFESKPVRWANQGKFSMFLARMFKTSGPPILVVSLPRSGSSWVGEVLGSSKNALYLREPITQSYMAEGGKYTIVDIDPNLSGLRYQYFANLAFSGVPAFPRTVVIFPTRWSLLARRKKRLVIKEVNPLACQWLLQTYRPRVIFLVRHPAAVARSWKKLGWITSKDELLSATGRLLKGPLRPWKETVMSASSFWEMQGALQGAVLRHALDCFAAYEDFTTIRYEDLCTSPIKIFHDLFHFSGLPCNHDVEELILAKSSGANSAVPYSTMRNSKTMPDAWKGKIAAADLDSLRKHFCDFELPLYNTPGDW